MREKENRGGSKEGGDRNQDTLPTQTLPLPIYVMFKVVFLLPYLKWNLIIYIVGNTKPLAIPGSPSCLVAATATSSSVRWRILCCRWISTAVQTELSPWIKKEKEKDRWFLVVRKKEQQSLSSLTSKCLVASLVRRWMVFNLKLCSH